MTPRKLKQRRPLLTFAVALVVMGLVGAAVLSWWGSRGRASAARAMEAKAGVRALCAAVAEYHRGTGAWVAAGPLPASLPGGEPVEFPRDAAFERLGFSPGKVSFQYQVDVSKSPDAPPHVRCVASGGRDFDGTLARYIIEIDETGALGPLSVERG